MCPPALSPAPPEKSIFFAALDIRRFQEIHGVFVVPIRDAVNDACNPRIDQCFGAIDAWRVGHVAGGSIRGDAVQRSLNDGVCLGVDRARTVTVHHEVADFIANVLPSRRSVESADQDAFIRHQDTTLERASHVLRWDTA